MYYVNYVDLRGTEHSVECQTRDEAVNYYRTHLHEMAYGYISDDEALITAEEVKRDFEAEMERRREERRDLFRGLY